MKEEPIAVGANPEDGTYQALVRVQRALRLLHSMGRIPGFVDRPRAQQLLRRAVIRINRREAKFKAAMQVCPRPFQRGASA